MFKVPIIQVKDPSPWDALLGIRFNFEKTKKKHTARRCSDIITFDIETTTLYTDFVDVWGFNHVDYANNPARYQNAAAFAIMYVWQMAIETPRGPLVFMGRTWDEFREFMDYVQMAVACSYENVCSTSFDVLRENYAKITKKKNFRRVAFRVYVHNLGFEFQFLRNIYEFDFAAETESDRRKQPVFARTARKPMRAEFNFDGARVVFHDTLVLTQKSLAAWCKDAGLPSAKLKTPPGYYDIIRTPNTKLSRFEVEYSINDVVSMVYGIDLYRQKYGTLSNIPMTQTGEVRRTCIEKVAKANPAWSALCSSISASMDFDFFKVVTKAFGGGWTHANSFYTGKTLRGVRCFDFASDYPFCMCCFKYPVSPFVEARTDEDKAAFFDEMMVKDPRGLDIEHKFYVEFEAEAIRSRTSCTFWSVSKCEELDDWAEDNGKIYTAGHIRAIMTDCDFHVFIKAYATGSIKILRIWRAEAGLLPSELVETILSYYLKKTELKKRPDRLSEYVESKQFINSIYGVAVTRVIGDQVYFIMSCEDETTDAADWVKRELTVEDYEEMRAEYEDKGDEFITYPIGTFVTAYARSSLWYFILKLDKHVIYGDTDSLKGLFDAEDISFINEYNEWVAEREREIADLHGLDEALFHPKDKKGTEHRLGVFDTEATCIEFRTLGAKRYVDTIRVSAADYKPDKMKAIDFFDNGDAKVIQATVAGLPKSAAVSILDDVDDFKPGTVWDTAHAGKQMSVYNDEQPEGIVVTDRDGVTYTTSELDRHGIALVPTTFDLEYSDVYANFLNWISGIGEPQTKVSKILNF